MIHIITVHWKTPFWIAPQLNQIRRTTTSPFKIYSFYSGIDVERYRDEFAFLSSTEIKPHAIKLNMLAEIACEAATDSSDLLVFLDSDAFPIRPWEEPVRDLLQSVDLVAVRRDENLRDIQPHPSFCVTTVGFWESINGDWQAGYRWINAAGNSITDVGGNLLEKLTKLNKSWHPLTRSRTLDLHPMWFGIYGDLVYHHGAGSRRSLSRLDRQIVRDDLDERQPVYYRFLRGVGLKKLAIKAALAARQRRNKSLSLRIMKIVNEVDFADRIFSISEQYHDKKM